MSSSDAELRVSAHVLVQLGNELVTDVEQAILECVKNSYDADSPGCRIEIDTREEGVQFEFGTAGRLKRFDTPSETVDVTFLDANQRPLTFDHEIKDHERITRRLGYTGR